MPPKRRAADRRSSPAPGEPTSDDRKLTLALPAAVVRELKLRMVAEDTTMRALILEALLAAGYPVPPAEIRDRRRQALAGDAEARPAGQPLPSGAPARPVQSTACPGPDPGAADKRPSGAPARPVQPTAADKRPPGERSAA